MNDAALFHTMLSANLTSTVVGTLLGWTEMGALALIVWLIRRRQERRSAHLLAVREDTRPRIVSIWKCHHCGAEMQQTWRTKSAAEIREEQARADVAMEAARQQLRNERPS